MEIFRSVHTNALTMFTWFFKDNSHFWDGRPELRHFRRIWRILWDRAVRGDSVLHDRSDILYKVTQFIYGGSLIFVNMQLIARFIYNAHKHVAIYNLLNLVILENRPFEKSRCITSINLVYYWKYFCWIFYFRTISITDASSRWFLLIRVYWNIER